MAEALGWEVQLAWFSVLKWRASWIKLAVFLGVGVVRKLSKIDYAQRFPRDWGKFFIQIRFQGIIFQITTAALSFQEYPALGRFSVHDQKITVAVGVIQKAGLRYCYLPVLNQKLSRIMAERDARWINWLLGHEHLVSWGPAAGSSGSWFNGKNICHMLISSYNNYIKSFALWISVQ